jgi:light-regulated signal transduction histidine kinase (bacteriophytochrome)
VVLELEEFSYTISHDLKSPLRAIDGYSKFIIEDYGNTLHNEVREMVSSIQEISKDMIGLINRLLEYSITSKTKVFRESVQIRQLITTVFREFQVGNPERNMNIVFEEDLPMVSVDKVLFKQVIANAISNAVKFSKDKETTEILVGFTKLNDEHVFYIKDNGVGFDMKFASKLFGIFQRLHRSQDFEGAGVGLATIKKIIQKHGGRVWIEGALNEGATLFFTLPATMAAENEVLNV